MGTFVKTLQWIGTVASVILPFFNIPLIMRIVKRKSADDISLVWVFGVWACILAMVPTTFLSQDPAFRWFGYINTVFFTGVVFVTVKYHHRFKKNKG